MLARIGDAKPLALLLALTSAMTAVPALARTAKPVQAAAQPAATDADKPDAALTQPMDGKPILLSPGRKVSSPFPTDRSFVAVSFKDQTFKNDRPSFQVSSSNRAFGFGSCNNWSATILARKDQRFAVGPVAITKRQCDAKLMHNEQVYLFVLQNAETWFYDGRVLTLTGRLGTLTLEPAV